MKLKMFQEAITWCDQGLAVSFDVRTKIAKQHLQTMMFIHTVTFVFSFQDGASYAHKLKTMHVRRSYDDDVAQHCVLRHKSLDNVKVKAYNFYIGRPCYGHLTPVKQGIHLALSHDPIAGSGVRLTEG